MNIKANDFNNAKTGFRGNAAYLCERVRRFL
jgi:hypothetical protein